MPQLLLRATFLVLEAGGTVGLQKKRRVALAGEKSVASAMKKT